MAALYIVLYIITQTVNSGESAIVVLGQKCVLQQSLYVYHSFISIISDSRDNVIQVSPLAVTVSKTCPAIHNTLNGLK